MVPGPRLLQTIDYDQCPEHVALTGKKNGSRSYNTPKETCMLALTTEQVCFDTGCTFRDHPCSDETVLVLIGFRLRGPQELFNIRGGGTSKDVSKDCGEAAWREDPGLWLE